MTKLNSAKIVEDFLYRLHTSPQTLTITKRQAEKFSRRLNDISFNGDIKSKINHVVALAQDRVKQAKPTVYIANIGSSGSHWLQALLTHAGGLMPCGETYFPEEQFDELHENPDIREAFIHAVYLVMGWSSDADKLTSGAINTAHKPFLPHVKSIDTGSKSILLVRDPFDVVMSRTFRKGEYRAYLGHEDTSDMDYLKSNARYVRSFYRKALKNEFDIIVRYEDIRKDGPGVVGNVFRAINIPVDENKILQVVDLLHNDATPGSKAEPPAEEYVFAAKFITAEVREALGYS